MKKKKKLALLSPTKERKLDRLPQMTFITKWLELLKTSDKTSKIKIINHMWVVDKNIGKN